MGDMKMSSVYWRLNQARTYYSSFREMTYSEDILDIKERYDSTLLWGLKKYLRWALGPQAIPILGPELSHTRDDWTLFRVFHRSKPFYTTKHQTLSPNSKPCISGTQSTPRRHFAILSMGTPSWPVWLQLFEVMMTRKPYS